MNFWTYSPEDIQVLVGGFYRVDGLSEGTFVEVSKDVMPYTSSRSADGMVGRKFTNNNTYTVKITVMSTSAANDLFTRLWLLDELTQMAKFPLLIKDSIGSGYFFSASTWFEQIPPLSFSTSVENRVWGLRSNEGIIHIGGNDPISDIENVANMALSALPLVQQVLNGGI
jgi:hypothetical protein